MSPHIIVLDDDETFREFLHLLLEHEGHAVVSTSTVAEARAAIEKLPPGEPLCLVIDIVLDRESGIEFAQSLARKNPNHRILLISGFTDEVLLTTPDDTARIAFLRKPFVRAEIVNALDRLWAAPAPAPLRVARP